MLRIGGWAEPEAEAGLHCSNQFPTSCPHSSSNHPIGQGGIVIQNDHSNRRDIGKSIECPFELSGFMSTHQNNNAMYIAMVGLQAVLGSWVDAS